MRDGSRVAWQTKAVRPTRSLLVVGALVFTLSCSKAPRPGVASFCEKLGKDRLVLDMPMTTPENITAMVGRYRELDRLSPEEIKDQWHAVTELIAKIAGADVSTRAKQQDIVTLIYATTKSINDVKKYTKETCGVDFALPVSPPSTLVTDSTTTTA